MPYFLNRLNDLIFHPSYFYLFKLLKEYQVVIIVQVCFFFPMLIQVVVFRIFLKIFMFYLDIETIIWKNFLCVKVE